MSFFYYFPVNAGQLRQFEMSVHGVHAEQIPEMMSLRYSLYLYSVGQKKHSE